MFNKKLIKNFDFLILILIMLLTGFGLIGISVAMRSPVEGTEEGLRTLLATLTCIMRLHLMWFAAARWHVDRDQH